MLIPQINATVMSAPSAANAGGFSVVAACGEDGRPFKERACLVRGRERAGLGSVWGTLALCRRLLANTTGKLTGDYVRSSWFRLSDRQTIPLFIRGQKKCGAKMGKLFEIRWGVSDTMDFVVDRIVMKGRSRTGERNARNRSLPRVQHETTLYCFVWALYSPAFERRTGAG